MQGTGAQVAYVAVLAIIVWWAIHQRTCDVDRLTVDRLNINTLETALGTYMLDTGSYPTTSQGLEALLQRPAGVSGWKGPYLPIIRLDSWGRPYGYRYPSDHGDEPDIFSYGADGRPGGVGKDADFYSWRP